MLLPVANCYLNLSRGLTIGSALRLRDLNASSTMLLNMLLLPRYL